MRFKNFISFALGPLATALFGIVALPAMALLFSPEDLGRLNMLQITLSFSLLLLLLSLAQAHVCEFHETTDRPLMLKPCFMPSFLLLGVGFSATASFALGTVLTFPSAWLCLALAPAMAWFFRTEWAGMLAGARGAWLSRAAT